ncbi:MAG: YcaO-like family protein, partial [Desulfobacterales bacterium]|nr:YcaO-like family protein [Desulfobacterales bacterium]
MDIPSFQLNDAYKQSRADQDKLITPEETVRRVKENFSRLDLDILAETVRIDTGRLDIPVFFSVCGADAARLTGTAKQMGKGATPAQAEASAVMELVERFSVYSFKGNPNNFIADTYENVRDQAIPFELIARSVHDEAVDNEISREIFSDLPLKWTWGYDLTNNRQIMVPFDWFFAINAFNGTSAGNCPEEAICQGICEIVERHVSALICRQKIPVPAINPQSATDPVVVDMLDKFRK